MGLSLNKQIAEEAAHWATTLDAGPLNFKQKSDLLSWLKTSPVHLNELLMALSLFECVGFSDPAGANDIDDILKQASVNVAPLAEASVSFSETPVATRGKRIWTGAAIAACLAILILTFQLLSSVQNRWKGTEANIISTALGEQRSVTLDDGSVVFVNTQSRIAVTYSDEYRTVEVERGEALFDVEENADRPFRVIAGDTIAEALGTRFNVRYINDEAEVSVIQGTVAVTRDGYLFKELDRSQSDADVADLIEVGALDDGRIILVAGESAELSATSWVPTLAVTNADVVSAWTTRRLMFDEDRLEDIAAEFNRYNRVRLVIESETLSNERLSGVFSADDPESLVDFLTMTNDVRVSRYGSTLRIEPGRHK